MTNFLQLPDGLPGLGDAVLFATVGDGTARQATVRAVRGLDEAGFQRPNDPTLTPQLGLPFQALSVASSNVSTTGDSSAFEFLRSYGMTVGTGAIPAGAAWGGAGDAKVLDYRGVRVLPGGGTSWVHNAVHRYEVGSTGSGFMSELDIDNLSAHCGDVDGIAGIYPSLAGGTGNPRVIVGTLLTGAGNYRTTAAHAVHGVRFDATTMQAFGDAHNRGYVVFGGCRLGAFVDYGSSARSYHATGTYTIGVDLQQISASAGAIFLKAENGTNSGAIQWSTGTQVVASLRSDAVGRLSTTGIALQVTGACLPATDNAYGLGSSAQRWANIWSVDGVVHTSDASTKVDVEPITAEQSAAFIEGVTPASYRLAETHDLVPTQVEQLVPEYDADGAPVMDHEPVLDEAGAPVMQRVQVRSRLVLDANGNPAESVREVPLLRPVQRLRPQMVTELRPVPRAGVRVHTGVMAGEVATASAAALGATSGAYVSPPDGPAGVRPDEIQAFALAELRFLRGRVAELEAAR